MTSATLLSYYNLCMKSIYVSPVVEMIKVSVDAGFATSGGAHQVDHACVLLFEKGSDVSSALIVIVKNFLANINEFNFRHELHPHFW